MLVPLPWYSKAAYDAVNDELRGGWRWLCAELAVMRNPFCPGSISVNIFLRIGIVVRFDGRLFTKGRL